MRPHETRDVPRSVHLNESRHPSIAKGYSRPLRSGLGPNLDVLSPFPSRGGSVVVRDHGERFALVPCFPVPSNMRPQHDVGGSQRERIHPCCHAVDLLRAGLIATGGSLLIPRWARADAGAAFNAAAAFPSP
jgi:hypothetical protein